MIRFTNTLVQSIVGCMSESSYIPGMCNINKAEIAYRKKAMWFGIGLSLALLVPLLILNAPWWLVSLVLFVPVYIGAIGYLQVTNHFCVSYGAQGKQNANEGSDVATDIIEEDALEADKRKTRKMNLQATAITIGVVVIAGLIAWLT